MKAKIILSAILTTCIVNVYAQGSADALRFSQVFNGGTARFTSMGGAFGALGGDFGSLTYNPAGLGVYRTSEFTFTPSFKSRSINSTYNGNSLDDSRTRFYFDNVGFVMSFKPNKSNETGLVNLNLGVGYNRTNDFFSSSLAKGNNENNSIMDYFAGIASNGGYYYDDLSQATNYNPFTQTSAAWEAIMAWNTYLIDTAVNGGGIEYTPALLQGDKVIQQNSVSTTGSAGEYVISLATNFSNKFYLGATLGVQNVVYSNSTVYSEFAYQSNGTLPNGDRFYSMDYKQTFETSGTGYNFKIGGIYKPVDGLRLGLAFHSPTYFNLTDRYSYDMFSDFLLGTSDSKTPNSRYDYNLETPMKFIGSIAYVYKDLGLLSLDYERVDYSSMRFREGGDGYNYTNENQNINNSFTGSNNIRVGGEIKAGDIFLRAGYALYGNPYKSGSLNDKSTYSTISGGIGYRSGNFFIDAAYLRTMSKEKYIYYDLRDLSGNLVVNPVSTKLSEGKMLVTLGFKF